jgi:hypothetical protein
LFPSIHAFLLNDLLRTKASHRFKDIIDEAIADGKHMVAVTAVV